MNIKQPKIVPEPESVTYDSVQEDEDQIFDGVEIIDERFSADGLRRLISYGSVIKDSNLSGNEFDGADLTDTRFVNCDFSNTTFSKASMHRVEFINCKMTGVNFDESVMKHIKFQESLLNFSGIHESKLENVSFEETRFVTADFFNVKFKNIEFEKCDLTESRFIDTSLSGVDISASYFESMSIKREDLEGCIVSSLQAVQMVTLMGLVVKDE